MISTKTRAGIGKDIGTRSVEELEDNKVLIICGNQERCTFFTIPAFRIGTTSDETLQDVS